LIDSPEVKISFGEVGSIRLAIGGAGGALVGVIGEIGLARWVRA